MKFLFLGFATLLVPITFAVSIGYSQGRPRDFAGSSAWIFEPPQNPVARTGKAKSTSETNTNVEDALTLGNAARDRNPPDFGSAEKAYRLAEKLDPTDPRPWIGLANVYWDQRRFYEAGQAYKQALSLVRLPKVNTFMSEIEGKREKSPSSKPLGGSIPKPKRRPHLRAAIGFGLSRGDTLSPLLNTYLAASLVEQDNPNDAEIAMRRSLRSNPRNSEWQGILGYILFLQSRYGSAARAFELALKHDPRNKRYEGFLKRSMLYAEEHSSNDKATPKQLNGRAWDIQTDRGMNYPGRCTLEPGGKVRCNYAGLDLLNWTIQDGFVELSSPVSATTCTGRLIEKTIQMRCIVPDQHLYAVWSQIEVTR